LNSRNIDISFLGNLHITQVNELENKKLPSPLSHAVSNKREYEQLSANSPEFFTISPPYISIL